MEPKTHKTLWYYGAFPKHTADALSSMATAAQNGDYELFAGAEDALWDLYDVPSLDEEDRMPLEVRREMRRLGRALNATCATGVRPE